MRIILQEQAIDQRADGQERESLHQHVVEEMEERALRTKFHSRIKCNAKSQKNITNVT